MKGTFLHHFSLRPAGGLAFFLPLTTVKVYKSISEPQEPRGGMDLFIFPFGFSVLLWVVYYLDQKFMLDLFTFGVFPQTWSGLQGILFAPLVHGSIEHLANNTMALLVLSMGLWYFYPGLRGRVFFLCYLWPSAMLWFFARPSYHIGASGLVYALAAFLFFSGLFRKNPSLSALSLIVVFLYGSLVWGLFPVEETISWEAHLSGFITGLVLALITRKKGPKDPVHPWEEETEEEVEFPYWMETFPGGEVKPEPSPWLKKEKQLF